MINTKMAIFEDGEWGDALIYGNKEHHNSFFLTAFAFGSKGPQDDKWFIQHLNAQTMIATGGHVQSRLHRSEHGVLVVWWDYDIEKVEARLGDIWYLSDLMDDAFVKTARSMGLHKTKKLDHSADVVNFVKTQIPKIDIMATLSILATGDIPDDVERYAKEVKESNPGYDDAKVWATAWSIYCKNKNPGSEHCKMNTNEYFKGALEDMDTLAKIAVGYPDNLTEEEGKEWEANTEKYKNVVKDQYKQADSIISDLERLAEGCPDNLDESECKEWEANTEKYKDIVKDQHKTGRDEGEDSEILEDLAGGKRNAFTLMDLWKRATQTSSGNMFDPFGPKPSTEEIFVRGARWHRISEKAIKFYVEVIQGSSMPKKRKAGDMEMLAGLVNDPVMAEPDNSMRKNPMDPMVSWDEGNIVDHDDPRDHESEGSMIPGLEDRLATDMAELGRMAQGCPDNLDPAECKEWESNTEKYKDVVKNQHQAGNYEDYGDEGNIIPQNISGMVEVQFRIQNTQGTGKWKKKIMRAGPQYLRVMSDLVEKGAEVYVRPADDGDDFARIVVMAGDLDAAWGDSIGEKTAAVKKWDSHFMDQNTASALGDRRAEYTAFYDLSPQDQAKARHQWPNKSVGAKYDFIDEHYYYPVNMAGQLSNGRRVLAIPYKMIENEQYMASLGYERNEAFGEKTAAEKPDITKIERVPGVISAKMTGGKLVIIVDDHIGNRAGKDVDDKLMDILGDDWGFSDDSGFYPSGPPKGKKNQFVFTKTAAQAPTGLYGYTRSVQSSCESSIRKMARTATKLAKEAYAKNEDVAPFLAAHAKRGGSLSAKILVAAMKDIGPKIASVMAKAEADADALPVGRLTKEAARKYGLYGYAAKTASLGLQACTSLRESAGHVTADLHGRKADSHEHITGFLREHSKQARCMYAKMLHSGYPDIDRKTASVVAPKSVDEWLAWGE